MAILVQDSFNRANGALGNADTGQAWLTSTANFVVSNNRGTVNTLDNTQFAYIDALQSDVVITSDWLSTGSAYSDCPKYLFRATDFTNGYVLRWSGTSWDIDKMVGGTLTILGSYASTSGPSSTNIVSVKIECSGSTINLYLGGTLVLTVTDTTYTGTKHGWGTMRVQGLIDNFLVESLSTGTDATITAPTATATADAIAPVITAQQQVTISAVVANITAEAIAPSVSIDAIISSAVASMTADALSPTISTDSIITSVVASATLEAIAPTVGSFTHVTVNSIVADLTASAIVPSVTAIGNVDIAASIANVTLDALVPHVGDIWDSIVAISTGWTDENNTTTTWIDDNKAITIWTK